MKITILGCTGDLGQECLKQAFESGHEITVLVRNPTKIPRKLLPEIEVVQGDALVLGDVESAIPEGTQAVLFAIGVDEKSSPPDLCTDVTKLTLEVMRKKQVSRLVWCGGGSNIVADDQLSFGAKFVRWYSERFLKHRHFDKEHQLELLDRNKDIEWIGVRPLQMKHGRKTGQYRLGFHRFSGMSKITFADCAHAMLSVLQGDKWLWKAPIVQY